MSTCSESRLGDLDTGRPQLRRQRAGPPHRLVGWWHPSECFAIPARCIEYLRRFDRSVSATRKTSLDTTNVEDSSRAVRERCERSWGACDGRVENSGLAHARFGCGVRGLSGGVSSIGGVYDPTYARLRQIRYADADAKVTAIHELMDSDATGFNVVQTLLGAGSAMPTRPCVRWRRRR